MVTRMRFPFPAPLLVLPLLLPSLAAADETALTLAKRLDVWTRALCAASEVCLPAPTGLGWDFAGTLARPESAGSATSLKQRFQGSPYSVELAVYWARPRVETDPDAIVTQVRLFHETRGLVAECSRYDDARASVAIGLGSCSGVVDGEQVGVSVSAPRPAR